METISGVDMSTDYDKTVSVVIPCYKVTRHIEEVILKIPKFVNNIICVDDCCPEHSGNYIKENIKDPRIIVLYNKNNMGVGGAVMHGFQYVVDNNLSDIVVKIDGDGQMDPTLITNFLDPIIAGYADYTKGNRFYNPEDVQQMPFIRLLGNVGLGFCNKISSGYYNIFDPTNGYIAVTTYTLSQMNFSRIHNRFFFESDMLYNLHLIKAKVLDIPMKATYGDEVSNLSVFHSLITFGFLHIRNAFKRIFFEYYLRDFSIGSIALPSGTVMLLFGIFFGLYNWITNFNFNVVTPTGTIMLCSLSVIIGFQLVLTFLYQDMLTVPKQVITPKHEYNKFDNIK